MTSFAQWRSPAHPRPGSKCPYRRGGTAIGEGHASVGQDAMRQRGDAFGQHLDKGKDRGVGVWGGAERHRTVSIRQQRTPAQPCLRSSGGGCAGVRHGHDNRNPNNNNNTTGLRQGRHGRMTHMVRQKQQSQGWEQRRSYEITGPRH